MASSLRAFEPRASSLGSTQPYFIFVWIDLQHDLKSDLESDLLQGRFRYFWLDSKGREASGGLAIVKEGGKAKGVERKRERESKGRKMRL